MFLASSYLHLLFHSSVLTKLNSHIKLLLQPLVENCITHGIVPLKNKRMGLINITAVISETSIIFEISDNGIGIKLDKLKEINELLSSEQISEDQHIGINNVHKRIKLICGNDYGVKVNSIYGQGTTIELILPKILITREEI